MFLHPGKTDPRPGFLRSLQEYLPSEGSIVVFNAPFETGRMKECCEFLPEFKPWWNRTANRIVDLLDPFRSFAYYHPDQQGSASIKSVMPALTGKGYEDLDIQEGGMASREFLRITFTAVSEDERHRVRQQLDEYCGLDTGGMVRIVESLQTLF